MTEARDEFDRLAEELHRHIADFVDGHLLTRDLRAVAKRNMAYCGAHAAISALWPDDLPPAPGVETIPGPSA